MNILKTEGRRQWINLLEYLVVPGQGKRWDKNNQSGKSMREIKEMHVCMPAIYLRKIIITH